MLSYFMEHERVFRVQFLDLPTALFGKVPWTISKSKRLVLKTGVIMYIKKLLGNILTIYLHIFIFVIKLKQNMNISLFKFDR